MQMRMSHSHGRSSGNGVRKETAAAVWNGDLGDMVSTTTVCRPGGPRIGLAIHENGLFELATSVTTSTVTKLFKLRSRPSWLLYPPISLSSGGATGLSKPHFGMSCLLRLLNLLSSCDPVRLSRPHSRLICWQWLKTVHLGFVYIHRYAVGGCLVLGRGGWGVDGALCSRAFVDSLVSVLWTPYALWPRHGGHQRCHSTVAAVLIRPHWRTLAP